MSLQPAVRMTAGRAADDQPSELMYASRVETSGSKPALATPLGLKTFACMYDL